MLRKLACVVACLLMTSTAAMAAPVDAAYGFVMRQRIGHNLTPIAMDTASRTQAYAALVSEFGADKTKATVATELAALIPQYQQRWNNALAQAHIKFYTVDEMNALAKQGRESKFIHLLPERQHQVGAEMETLGKPILIELVNGALQRSFVRLSLKK